MDIGGWLRELGLGQYEQLFRDNAIDTEILSELTDSDLERLGVFLGHRRKLFKAIAALREVQEPSAKGAAARSRQETLTAERRQLTVMFIDLVGSTALSTRLDPEEMREVMRAYQSTAASELVHFDGHVAKFMGDGIVAYFGWPRAHEDEAERAVRAALRILDAVGRIATPSREALAARIGIATGVVVVGDLIGEGAAQEEAVIGDTPNPQLAFSLSRIPMRWSSARVRGAFSAVCSSSRIWADSRSRVWPRRSKSSACSDPVKPKAGSRRFTVRDRNHSSVARPSCPCCSTAGSGRRLAKGRWFSSAASLASASRGSSWRCANG